MGLSDVVNLLNYAESKGISWTPWLFNQFGCPCLITDNTTFAPTLYGAEVKSRLQAAAIILTPTPTRTPTPRPTATPTLSSSPTPTAGIGGPSPTVTPTLTPTPTTSASPTVTATIVPPTTSPTPTPVPIACSVISAAWGEQSVVEGATVDVIVATNNVPSCIGKQVSFRVKKDNGLLPHDDVKRNPLPSAIDSGGAKSTWVAEFSFEFFGLFNTPEYYFEANIVGESEAIRSAPPKLKVSKADSLVILGTPTVTTTENSATISWETNRESSSRVSYGLAKQHKRRTLEQDLSPRVTSHTVTLPSLKTCTFYQYRTVSREQEAPLVGSSDVVFVTKGCNASVIDSETTDTIVDDLTGRELDTIDEEEEFPDGLTLSIPASFLDSDANFQILRLNDSEFVGKVASIPAGLTVANHVYHLNSFLEDEDTKVTDFTKELTVSIKYKPTDIVDIDENTLTIYKLSEDGGWSNLSNCILTKEQRTVTCLTSSFSDFVLLGEPLEPAPYNTPDDTPYGSPSDGGGYGTPGYGSPSYGSPSYQTPSSGKQGDLNSDGKVNIFDLSTLLRNWNR